jgi:hypothetical protein
MNPTPTKNIETALLDKLETILASVKSATADLQNYRFSARTLEYAMDVICELDEEGTGHWLNDRLDVMIELINDQAFEE